QGSILSVVLTVAGRVPKALLLARRRGDELGHGLDLRVAELALEGRHDRPAVRDLLDDPLLVRLELVEVRADGAGGARGRERVTAGAVRREDRLAAARAAAARRARATRSAARRAARRDPR